jgi:hypothetical protein
MHYSLFDTPTQTALDSGWRRPHDTAMHAPQELGPGAGAKSLAEDFLVAPFGLATNFLVALLLWWIETKFGFAFYSWTFWFVVPVGALFAGFAGASGYYVGSLLLGHRPTRLLLLNLVIGSVLTFLLIHYLAYMTLQIEGKKVSDYIPFSKYLDIAIRSTSMKILGSKTESTGELGSFGYVIAVLQVIGFAVGGFCVYAYLAAKPYCNRCSRYLSGKGKQIRYASDPEGLQTATAQLARYMGNDEVGQAVEEHRNSVSFGVAAAPKDCHLRSVIEVQRCKKCERHWVKFAVENLSDNNWNEVSGLTIERFTEQPVNVGKL